MCTDPLSIISTSARKFSILFGFFLLFKRILIAFLPSSLTGKETAVIGGVLKSITKGPSNVIIEISFPIFKFKKLQTLIALRAEYSVEQIIADIFLFFDNISFITLKLFSGSSNLTEAMTGRILKNSLPKRHASVNEDKVLDIIHIIDTIVQI